MDFKYKKRAGQFWADRYYLKALCFLLHVSLTISQKPRPKDWGFFHQRTIRTLPAGSLHEIVRHWNRKLASFNPFLSSIGHSDSDVSLYDSDTVEFPA
jgi:hypothetical protein